MNHKSDCILAWFNGGRITEEGKEEFWYGVGSKEVWCDKDIHPKCECGLDETPSNTVPPTDLKGTIE